MTMTILEYLQKEGRQINAVCAGHHKCGRCLVRLLNRTVNLTEHEKRILSSEKIERGFCLACMHVYEEGDIIETEADEITVHDDAVMSEEGWRYRPGTGLAADLGTTTVVMKWIDLETGKEIHGSAFMNPQTSYGADVISRIAAYPEAGKEMHDVLIRRMEEEIIKAGINITEMVLAGNTVMTHLFLQEDPSPMGVYPFRVPVPDLQKRNAEEIFPHTGMHFPIVTFPHISAYVGGDITAGLYALDLDQTEEPVLFMDLGTNGELVYCGEKRIASSAAAGPAFEGSGIRCGGGSIPGAVSAVKLDPLRIETIGDQEPVCICGSGIISLTAELVRHGMLESTGQMKYGEADLGNGISFGPADLVNVQLAKAAVQAGVRILLKNRYAGRVYIAGGFGKGIDPADLKTLHILPEHMTAESAGNTSMAGCIKLLMRQDTERVQAIARETDSVELAAEEDFQKIWIESLYF